MRLLVICAVAAFPQLAFAQQAAPELTRPPVATPAQPATAAATAEANRLIERAGAQELFEEVSEGVVPAVRHLRSGVKCTFEAGAGPNQIVVYDQGAARGDDVSCQTESMKIITTLYVTRFPPEFTVHQQLEGAVAAIKQRLPDARPYTGQSADARSDGLPEILSARFEFGADEGRRLTKVQLSKVGPWTLKLRTTGPLEPPMATDLMSEINFAAVLTELVD